MDTLFELKIKSIEVRVDAKALYIMRDGQQVFKISHKEIKALVLLAVSKVKQLQASYETND